MMTVDLDQTDPPLATLLAAVESRGETVVICRRGQPVAELRAAPAAPGVDPVQTHPEANGKILYNPAEPAEDDPWPSHLPEPDPAAKFINPLQIHPELAGKILYDPTEPATEDEWPSDPSETDPFAKFTDYLEKHPEPGSIVTQGDLTNPASEAGHLSETLDGPPTLRGINRLKQHPQLKVTFLCDPMEPASEDEWPSEFR